MRGWEQGAVLHVAHVEGIRAHIAPGLDGLVVECWQAVVALENELKGYRRGYQAARKHAKCTDPSQDRTGDLLRVRQV